MKKLEIREAVAEDSHPLLRFIKELAIYEKAEHEVTAKIEDIRESIFSAISSGV